MAACGPRLQMTATWKDENAQPANFNQVLVLAIVKDLQVRQMAEDAIATELRNRGVNAVTSLAQFSPEFNSISDSARIREMLLEKNIDAVLTARVLNIDERDRWMPGGAFPAPFGLYRGFYSYYNFHAFGNQGFVTTDVEVLLESNFYNLRSNDLVWTGQSTAFTRDPSPELARRYAKNVVDDIFTRNVIAAAGN